MWLLEDLHRSCLWMLWSEHSPLGTASPRLALAQTLSNNVNAKHQEQRTRSIAKWFMLTLNSQYNWHKWLEAPCRSFLTTAALWSILACKPPVLKNMFSDHCRFIPDIVSTFFGSGGLGVHMKLTRRRNKYWVGGCSRGRGESRLECFDWFFQGELLTIKCGAQKTFVQIFVNWSAAAKICYAQ